MFLILRQQFSADNINSICALFYGYFSICLSVRGSTLNETIKLATYSNMQQTLIHNLHCYFLLLTLLHILKGSNVILRDYFEDVASFHIELQTFPTEKWWDAEVVGGVHPWGSAVTTRAIKIVVVSRPPKL